MSDSEPSGQHVPAGKIDGAEDKPVSSHTTSWHLCQKQNMGLRARGVQQATPMFSQLKPLAEQKEKPHRFGTYGYKHKLLRERKRGPLMPCRDATDGHRCARVSKVTEASYVV